MCLRTFQMYDRSQHGIGYKVFRKKGEGAYSGLVMAPNGIPRTYDFDNPQYHLGQAYEAKTSIIGLHAHFGLYPTGFHILKTEEDANKLIRIWPNSSRNLVAVKVYYNLAFGEGDDECGLPTIIATFMNLVEEVKECV